MSMEMYQVRVIYYLNPHLIWVEVVDPSKTVDDYTFEQVGLYGVLPLDKTLDIELEELKVQKCDNWIPAATKIVKDILYNNNTEVWFSPTYIDRRTSIFDSNIHKFGELMTKNKDGTLKNIKQLLIKTNLAYYDVTDFHQKLSNGNLNTKLSPIKTQEVIKEFEIFYTKDGSNSKWKTSLKKHISVFQMSQEFESLLTVKNVERHNNEFLNKIIEKKAKDFELCKDINEEPVGCGYKPQSNVGKNLSAFHHRQSIYRSQSSNHYDKTFDDIKTFLTKNSKVKCENESEFSEQSSRESALNALLNKKMHLKSESRNEVVEGTKENINIKDNITEKGSSNAVNTDQNAKGKSSKYTPHSSGSKVFVQQVAYGPPGLNPTKYKIELKSIEPEVEILENVRGEPNKIEIDKGKLFASSESNDFEENVLKRFLKQINNAKNVDYKEKYEETKKEAKDVEKETKDDNCNKVPSEGLSIVSLKMKALENLSKEAQPTGADTLKSLNNTTDDSDEDIDEIYKRINAKYKKEIVENIGGKEKDVKKQEVLIKNHVNPFKNFDSDISVFVDKLVSPVLMVHLKIDRRVQPVQNLRDVCFNRHIHEVLKNMAITSPMMLQTVSWPVILRGYSLFMIGPVNSGKTMGYMPAVCRLVSDPSPITDSSGPIAIIVCATAKLVANIEKMAKLFLRREDRVLACFSGVDDMHITTTLLNGCDLLIATPPYLVKLMQKPDFGVDLRRLSIFVLDDCERLFDVYADEIKIFQIKIKKMLKKRSHDELKVQYVLASRVWCENMEALALMAPDTVVCISAFQECVLYSKTNMSVTFVKNDKVKCLKEFLEEIDRSKKTVIVCKSDEEVEMLEKTLKKDNQIIYATNNSMTVHDLYNISVLWSECNVPESGPILICCDGNLVHMNVTDAHSLIHYSLPNLYSTFCKRFSVLNDNYPSIFKTANDIVKIKVFVEECETDQLPKIINFIKRCKDVPEILDNICKNILKEKDAVRAQNLVPLCHNFLLFGECPDRFYCHDRHTILKDYDTPINWLPTKGYVTFKVLHYNSAILFSGRLLTNIVNGDVQKYPQTYSALSLKMGMFYSKEANRKLHGIPKVGDMCAVAIKVNLFARCKVVKILSKYEKGNPNNVLVKLIDEEWYEVTRDFHLYYLPEELRSVQTHVAQIMLVNVTPIDNDITFSDLAKNHIKNIIDSEDDTYLRGHIALTIGNCVFVDTLETCQHLTSVNEVIVKHNIKHELLKGHAIHNESLLPNLIKLCIESGITMKQKYQHESNLNEEETAKIDEKEKSTNLDSVTNIEEGQLKQSQENVNKDKADESQIKSPSVDNFNINNDKVENISQTSSDKEITRKPSKGKWESLQSEILHRVYLGGYKTPDQFFIRLADNEPSMVKLLDKVDKYVVDIKMRDVNLQEGEIVLAKFPDDTTYERARVDEVNGDNVKCFFLDQGDWMEISKVNLLPITVEILDETPFQAIECKLLGVQTTNGIWNDATNKWLYDFCHEDVNGKLKDLYAKYYTKEAAEYTDDFKYGIILFETCGESDVLINRKIIELGLAEENPKEVQYFEKDTLFLSSAEVTNESTDQKEEDKEENTLAYQSVTPFFLPKPIRTVPLVNSDDSDDDDKWEVNMSPTILKNIASCFINSKKPTTAATNMEENKTIVIGQNKPEGTKPKLTSNNKDTPVNQLSNADEMRSSTSQFNEKDPIRKPKLIWRQNKDTVNISILIDVEKYDLKIEDKRLKFKAELNNSKYEFDIELYGVIDKGKCSHEKRGLIISIKLEKYSKKQWLSLVSSKESVKNWISYDMSTLDTSSDEESLSHDKDLEEYIKRTRNEESESDEEEVEDDLQR